MYSILQIRSVIIPVLLSQFLAVSSHEHQMDSPPVFVNEQIAAEDRVNSYRSVAPLQTEPSISATTYRSRTREELDEMMDKLEIPMEKSLFKKKRPFSIFGSRLGSGILSDSNRLGAGVLSDETNQPDQLQNLLSLGTTEGEIQQQQQQQQQLNGPFTNAFNQGIGGFIQNFLPGLANYIAAERITTAAGTMPARTQIFSDGIGQTTVATTYNNLNRDAAVQQQQQMQNAILLQNYAQQAGNHLNVQPLNAQLPQYQHQQNQAGVIFIRPRPQHNGFYQTTSTANFPPHQYAGYQPFNSVATTTTASALGAQGNFVSPFYPYAGAQQVFLGSLPGAYLRPQNVAGFYQPQALQSLQQVGQGTFTSSLPPVGHQQQQQQSGLFGVAALTANPGELSVVGSQDNNINSPDTEQNVAGLAGAAPIGVSYDFLPNRRIYANQAVPSTIPFKK